MSTMQELIQEIADRQKAMSDQIDSVPNEAKIRELIETSLPDVVSKPEFIRKMRFGGETDQSLVGSKFARWGATAADIEMLYDIQLSLQGGRRVDGNGTYKGPSPELEAAFKACSDAYYIDEAEARRIDATAIDNLFGRIPKSEYRNYGISGGRKGLERAREAAHQRASSMDSGTSGFGSQLVGAQYVGNIWDQAFQDSMLQNQINTFEMTAPTAYLPVAVDMPEPIYVAESTSDVLATAQYATVRTGSNRVSVTATKMLIHQVWSGEMEEDSIIPLLPFYRAQAARSLAFYGDSVILNGDTDATASTNINLIDATPAATKFYLSANGMRKVGLIDNTANKADCAGAVTLAQLRNLKQLMIDSTRFVDWGHPNDPKRLFYITDPQTADRIATLDEVLQAKVELAANAGLLGSPLNGQVATILGNPLISTMAMSLTDATGKVSTTGSNNTKGQVVAANLDGYVVGWRRRVQIESERIAASDQTRIVYSYRSGVGRFNPGGNVNTQEHAAVLYDISLS